MRADELGTALADAAARVPPASEPVLQTWQRRVRRTRLARVAAGAGVAGAVLIAVVAGPHTAERDDVGAVAVDTREPAACPRRLGPAVSAVASTTGGLVWLGDSDGSAREVMLGGLVARGPIATKGSLVAATDGGLLVQTSTGAAVVDPATGGVVWSAAGATALGGRGHTVAWCRPGGGRVRVTVIGVVP